ncbi:putative phosphoserine aminotransferase, chloroplastic-like [Capsicum annuum]|nr:putative phosphoserine aminotransferase, chloroplastic-like [Capsicum annuum]
MKKKKLIKKKMRNEQQVKKKKKLSRKRKLRMKQQLLQKMRVTEVVGLGTTECLHRNKHSTYRPIEGGLPSSHPMIFNEVPHAKSMIRTTVNTVEGIGIANMPFGVTHRSGSSSTIDFNFSKKKTPSSRKANERGNENESASSHVQADPLNVHVSHAEFRADFTPLAHSIAAQNNKPIVILSRLMAHAPQSKEERHRKKVTELEIVPSQVPRVSKIVPQLTTVARISKVPLPVPPVGNAQIDSMHFSPDRIRKVLLMWSLSYYPKPHECNYSKKEQPVSCVFCSVQVGPQSIKEGPYRLDDYLSQSQFQIQSQYKTQFSSTDSRVSDIVTQLSIKLGPVLQNLDCQVLCFSSVSDFKHLHLHPNSWLTSEDAPEVPEGTSDKEHFMIVEAWKHSDFLCTNYILSDLQDYLYNVYSLIVNDKFQVAAIIKKLPPMWKDFKNYLKHKRKKMSVEDFIVRLRIEEDNKAAERSSKGNSTINGAHIVEDVQNNSKKRKKVEQGSIQPKKNFKGKCFNCGKISHESTDCRASKKGKKKDQANMIESNKKCDDLCAMFSECNLVGNLREWWMASGATRHVCANKELFPSFVPA